MYIIYTYVFYISIRPDIIFSYTLFKNQLDFVLSNCCTSPITQIDRAFSPKKKPIFEHMQTIGRLLTMISYSSKKSKLSNSKVQTIIITRDELQNKIYGA